MVSFVFVVCCLFSFAVNVTAKVFPRPAGFRMLGHGGKSSYGVLPYSEIEAAFRAGRGGLEPLAKSFAGPLVLNLCATGARRQRA
jgi:hypothetical protein